MNKSQQSKKMPDSSQLYIEEAINAIYNKKVTYARRYAIASAWVKSLQHIATLLPYDYSLDEASMLLEFDVGLSIPVALANGRWGMQRHSFDEYAQAKFYITPLVTSDGKLHPYFAGIVGRASYHEAERTIYLPPHKLSDTWKGIVLYHEVLHAGKHQRRLQDGTEQDHWAEEYEVYMDELAIVGQLYGRAYHQAAHDIATRLLPSLEAGKLKFKPATIASTALLAAVFGKPASTYERSIQRGLLLLDGMYRAIQRSKLDANVKRQEYAAITEWFYAKQQRPSST
jgi:hypothetical protein